MPEHNPLHEQPPNSMTFEEVLDQWVDQEGDRYAALLIERGFLLPEEKMNPKRVREVTREWRRSAAEGLQNVEWHAERLPNLAVVPEWRLGGYRGWSLYRPAGQAFTTFADVVARLDDRSQEVPQDHRTRIPEMAEHIAAIIQQGKIFTLRLGNDVAVLEGTHRMTALAYAILHHLPVPKELTVYEARLPEDAQTNFAAFCHDIPRRYGPHPIR